MSPDRRGRRERGRGRERRSRRGRPPSRLLAASGWFIAVVGLLSLGLSLSGAVSADDDGPDPGAIRISGGGLEPQHVEAGSDEVLSWTNEDARVAVLSFEEGFLERFACDEAGRPELREDATGRVQSLPIRSLVYALPCPLDPGTYPYQVHLLERIGRPGAPVAAPGRIRNPSATFEGTIVVR